MQFSFGKNRASYADRLTADDVTEAIRGLRRLLGGERLDGRRVIDVGSGSGIHSLEALRLGAAEVMAVDIDPDSVATTQAVLDLYAPGAFYRVARASIFLILTPRRGVRMT